MAKSLTPKQQRFAAEYLIDLNATQAAIRSGYSAKTAYSAGQRLLKHVEVGPAIEAAKRERLMAAGVTAKDVITELSKIGFANMGDYLKSTSDGDPRFDYSTLTRDQKAALAEVTVEDFVDGRGADARDVRRVKFRLADKIAALERLGRHLGMFVDRHVYEGTIEHQLSLMSPAERLARAEELLQGAVRYLPFLEAQESEQADRLESESEEGEPADESEADSVPDAVKTSGR
jgi:phage terminase small subunit